ncbi:MAG TPA: SDR family NAD(P)-dependent oxidoreductase [Aggregatilineales bacterium]|nr:SDR family NAD(P)-dependent oxidoreductase [Aggregatilineales bacterium]HQA67716.1 SDR family NAD(P)-dependent oxidoreductase [Aggregatilineales bacterium]HQE19728.1 SDR family NAD(P)-dependent oxidoreductase [Aggregatilineales bacterium]
MSSYVLITGAGGGLGRAFAAECASRGWDLFLTDVSCDVLEPLAQGIERLCGVRVQTYAADLTDPDAREQLWQHIERQGMRFHALLNVAGIDYQGPFDERRVDEVQRILRLNIEATVEMTQRVLHHRDPARTLRIVNVCSLAAFYPMPMKAVYAASKRFLLDWSLALSQELRGSGVTVTALCPAGMPSNPAVIRLIDAQGFMGRATTVNVNDVAAGTIRHALAGRSLYIPGVLNRILRLAGEAVPPQIVAALIDRRWRQSHEKVYGSSRGKVDTTATATIAAQQA